jgi:hypothetical protein
MTKKFHLIKYIKKHNKHYTKITLFDYFLNFNENLYMYHIWYIMVIVNFYIICICITYDTSWLLSTFTLYGDVSHMIQHVYWQPLSGARMIFFFFGGGALEKSLHPSRLSNFLLMYKILKYHKIVNIWQLVNSKQVPYVIKKFHLLL